MCYDANIWEIRCSESNLKVCFRLLTNLTFVHFVHHRIHREYGPYTYPIRVSLLGLNLIRLLYRRKNLYRSTIQHPRFQHTRPMTFSRLSISRNKNWMTLSIYPFVHNPSLSIITSDSNPVAILPLVFFFFFFWVTLPIFVSKCWNKCKCFKFVVTSMLMVIRQPSYQQTYTRASRT